MGNARSGVGPCRASSEGGARRGAETRIPQDHADVAWTDVGGETKQTGVVTFNHIDDTTTTTKIMLQLDYDA